jgi:hypothetical protein
LQCKVGDSTTRRVKDSLEIGWDRFEETRDRDGLVRRGWEKIGKASSSEIDSYFRSEADCGSYSGGIGTRPRKNGEKCVIATDSTIVVISADTTLERNGNCQIC